MPAPHSTAVLPDRALEFDGQPTTGFAHRALPSWNCFSSQTISASVQTDAKTAGYGSAIASRLRVVERYKEGFVDAVIQQASDAPRPSTPNSPLPKSQCLPRPLAVVLVSDISLLSVGPRNGDSPRNFFYSLWQQDDPLRCFAHPVLPGLLPCSPIIVGRIMVSNVLALTGQGRERH